MPLTGLGCPVSKRINSGTRPRPTATPYNKHIVFSVGRIWYGIVGVLKTT
jgi:hypothetical protein